MTVITSIALFVLAAIAEFGDAYVVGGRSSGARRHATRCCQASVAAVPPVAVPGNHGEITDRACA